MKYNFILCLAIASRNRYIIGDFTLLGVVAYGLTCGNGSSHGLLASIKEVLLVTHQLTRRDSSTNPSVHRRALHIIRRVIDRRLKLLLKRIVAVRRVQLLRQLSNALLIGIQVTLKHLRLEINIHCAAS